MSKLVEVVERAACVHCGHICKSKIRHEKRAYAFIYATIELSHCRLSGHPCEKIEYRT